MTAGPPHLDRDMVAKILGTLDLFAGLDPRSLGALSDALTAEDVQAQQILLKEGDRARLAYLVVRGRVGLFKEVENKARLRFAEVGQASIIGQEGLFDGHTNPYTAVATSRTLVLKCDRDGFERLTGDGRTPLGTCMVDRAVRDVTLHMQELRALYNGIHADPERFLMLQHQARGRGGPGP